MTINIDQFVASYLATAAWITADSHENNEFTPEAEEKAKKDCQRFIGLVTVTFGMDKALELLTIPGEDLSYMAPHDFFLTRNGHGAGFWDKPELYGGQENADMLTEISEEMGEVDCYHIADDNSPLTF